MNTEELTEAAAERVIAANDLDQAEAEPATSALAWNMGITIEHEDAMRQLVAATIDIINEQAPQVGAGK